MTTNELEGELKELRIALTETVDILKTLLEGLSKGDDGLRAFRKRADDLLLAMKRG
jgi:hypothetical protein